MTASPLSAKAAAGPPGSSERARLAIERVRETWAREETRGRQRTPSSVITAPANADGVWTHLGVPELAGHVAIYDPRRDRMLIFGGEDNGVYNYDLWSLSMTDAHPWKKLAVAGTHPALPRSAIYDPIRDRMVMLVGSWFDNSTANEVWTVNLSGTPQWTQLDTSGTKPGRNGPVIYDPVRDRLVITSGSASVWTLSLSGTPIWTELTATGTPAGERGLPMAIYDPVRDRMIFWGGETDDWPLPTEVWSLSLSGTPAWSMIPASGAPPVARYAATAIYDPGNDRMILYGGFDEHASLDDAWSLTLGDNVAWTQLDPPQPIPFRRSFHTAVYDSKRARMLIYSGWGWKHGPPDRNDVWALALAGAPVWTTVRGTSPEPRYAHTAIYDPAGDRMLIFGAGGYLSDSALAKEIWACSLDESPTWTLLHPAGEPPTDGFPHMVYDDVRKSLIGFDNSDIWEFTVRGEPAWKRLTTHGPAPAGIKLFFFDARRHRVVVLAEPDNSAWELSPSNTPRWKKIDSITPQPIPSGPYIYDRKHDRLLILDGTNFQTLWTLPLSGPAPWTHSNTNGEPPSRRYGYSLVYDEQRDRLVLLNGHSILGNGGGPWALPLSGELQWQKLAPTGWGPWADDGQSAIYDPVRDRMVVFGGRYYYNELNDAWVLTWSDTPVSAGKPVAPSALHAAYPNPFNPIVTIPFELTREGKVTLAIYDVAGRLVRTLVNEWTPRGSHETTWDGTGDRGERVASGVYFYRLQAPGISHTRKLVMMK